MRFFLALTLSFLPLLFYFSGFVLTYAQVPGELIVCGGEDASSEGGKCDFNKLIELFNKFLQYFIKYIVSPVAVGAIGYAGFLLIARGDKPGDKEKAKRIAGNILLGFFFIFGAYAIVRSLLVFVLSDSDSAQIIKRLLNVGN